MKSRITLADQRTRLNRARAQANADPTSTPNVLAKTAAYSPQHFAELFRDASGETIGAHLRRRRLDWAAARLILTKASIIDLALNAGFNSHEGFTRAFTARFGVAPSTFRRSGPNQRGAKILTALAQFFQQPR